VIESDENMSVPLGENNELYLPNVLCGYEFTLLPLSRSEATGVQVSQKCTKQQLAPCIRASSHLSAAFGRVLSVRVGTNISSDFIAEKAQGEE